MSNTASPLTFAVEPLELMLPEMMELSKEHAREVASAALSHPDIIVNPSWGSMLALAKIGLFVGVAVRRDGVLVGYATWLLAPDLHRTHADGSPLLAAMDDAHYLHPDARGPRAALRLFMESEAELRLRGVRKLSVHTKSHLSQERLFGALGYARDDVIMTKYLDPLPQVEAPLAPQALAAE